MRHGQRRLTNDRCGCNAASPSSLLRWVSTRLMLCQHTGLCHDRQHEDGRHVRVPRPRRSTSLYSVTYGPARPSSSLPGSRSRGPSTRFVCPILTRRPSSAGEILLHLGLDNHILTLVYRSASSTSTRADTSRSRPPSVAFPPSCCIEPQLTVGPATTDPLLRQASLPPFFQRPRHQGAPLGFARAVCRPDAAIPARSPQIN